MIAHLTLLTILQRVWGAIGVLLALSTVMLAAGAVAVGLTRGGEVAAGITAAAFAACALVLFIVGAANYWAGDAMERGRPNGRIAALTLAVLNLFVLPFGTALGIYAFWVLLHNETQRKFEV